MSQQAAISYHIATVNARWCVLRKENKIALALERKGKRRYSRFPSLRCDFESAQTIAQAGAVLARKQLAAEKG